MLEGIRKVFFLFRQLELARRQVKEQHQRQHVVKRQIWELFEKGGAVPLPNKDEPVPFISDPL